MNAPASDLDARLHALHKRIESAAKRAGRSPEEIALIGVSKRVPAAAVVLAVAAGLRHVGENYVQESIPKLLEIKEELAKRNIPEPRWHFIGQLQRNKAGPVATHFDLVETLDRASLGNALDRRAKEREQSLDALLQVNLSDEPQKGGVDPAELDALLATSCAWSNLRIVGLMTVPAASADPEASRASFVRLRELRDALRTSDGGAALTELSMGMSDDFEVAIEEGATIIRVGTALFGTREG